MAIVVRRQAVSEKTKETEQKREAAIASMNPLLRKEYEEIYGDILKQAGDNVTFYYKLGGRVDKVRQGAQYGDDAVDKLALAIDIDRSMVYRAMDFHSQYTSAEVKEILQRSSKAKRPVTWTHFSELLVVPDKQQRQELLELVLSKGLSVRDLVDEIRRRVHSGSGGLQRDLAPRSVMGGLSQMAGMSKRLIEKFSGDFRRVVFDPLGGLTDNQVDDSLKKMVNDAEARLQELADLVDSASANLQRVQGEIEIIESRRARERAASAQSNADTQKREQEGADPQKPAPKRRRPLESP